MPNAATVTPEKTRTAEEWADRLFTDCLSSVEQAAGLLRGITAFGPPLFSEVQEFEEGKFDILGDQGRAVVGIVYESLLEAGQSLALLERRLYDRPDWLFEAHGNLGIVACMARALMDPDHPPFLLDAYGLQEIHKRLVATKEILSDKWPAIKELTKRPALAQEEVAHA